MVRRTEGTLTKLSRSVCRSLNEGWCVQRWRRRRRSPTGHWNRLNVSPASLTLLEFIYPSSPAVSSRGVTNAVRRHGEDTFLAYISRPPLVSGSAFQRSQSPVMSSPIWFEGGGGGRVIARFLLMPDTFLFRHAVVLRPGDRPWTRVFFDTELCTIAQLKSQHSHARYHVQEKKN